VALVSTLPAPDNALLITHTLGDPTRYGIYRTIVEAAGQPLTVIDIAEQFSLHPNVARMHLQKLVDVGLVESDTRKSPGGGRPARIYRLSDRVANLQFPPRDYQLLAGLALQVVQTIAKDQPSLLDQAGWEMGRAEGAKGLRRDGIDLENASLDTILDSLRATCALLGLFPRVEREKSGGIRVELRNCVFRELSAGFPGLVCMLHTSLLRGILDAYLSEFSLTGESGPANQGGVCAFSVQFVTRTN
jgi:predicted ArsR family transcriptional regulator